ncbi:hypothetical protein SLA2020_312810 [Shorea laevis]
MELSPGNSFSSSEKPPIFNLFKLVRQPRISSGKLINFQKHEMSNSTRERSSFKSSGGEVKLWQLEILSVLRCANSLNPLGIDMRLLQPQFRVF